MSGGYFEHQQYAIHRIAEDLETVILNNGKKREHRESWENEYNYEYPPQVIAKFKEGLEYLKKAHIYANRIDRILSGDDGNESFLERLESDLLKL